MSPDVRRTGRGGTAARRRAPVVEAQELAPVWSAACALMRRTCGVVLEDDQVYLLDARLGPVARAYGRRSVSDLVRAACAAPSGSPLCADVIDALTTHETTFFRDAAFWGTLEREVLPALLRGQDPVRIWSAACSTGQEAYSLAILVEERWPAAAGRVEIIATDVAEPTLARARDGVYTRLEVNRGLSAARLVRCFDELPEGVRVAERLRRRVVFRRQNLLSADPYPPCDVVLCRNVLIYFDDRDRAAIQHRLARAAAFYVGVGCTERLGAYAPLAPGWYDARALRAQGA